MIVPVRALVCKFKWLDDMYQEFGFSMLQLMPGYADRAPPGGATDHHTLTEPIRLHFEPVDWLIRIVWHKWLYVLIILVTVMCTYVHYRESIANLPCLRLMHSYWMMSVLIKLDDHHKMARAFFALLIWTWYISLWFLGYHLVCSMIQALCI